MSFRLWTIFYVFALLAAAMATFGPWGIVVALVVLGFWMYWRKQGYSRAIWFGVAAAAAFFGLWALVDPARNAAHESAQRGMCFHNIHDLAVGILVYNDTLGTFPPAYATDTNGLPMHSWRVLIEPFAFQTTTLQSYNKKEPWDGPNNRKLAEHMPSEYRCPLHVNELGGKSTETSYFAVVGPETALTPGTGRKANTIRDGAAKTIMLIEANDRHVNWMEPRDLTIDEAVELLTTKPRSGHIRVSEGLLTTTYYETSFRYVAFCDGHGEYIGQIKDPAIARALLTADGGEPIPEEFDQEYVSPVSTTVLKWDRIWGFSVFVILSLLPVAWLRRHNMLTPPLNPPATAAMPD